MPNKWTLFVVAHTHWDREWFFSFERYRVRLVRIIDYLLDVLDRNPEFRSFTLDGQTVMLEDYLEVRPEMKEKIRKYVEEGRILIGPMYIAPDASLPSSESMVRNLMLGHIQGSKFGGVMKVAYMADVGGGLGGYFPQWPQILRGFGIDSLFVGRGMTIGAESPEEADKLKSEFLWEAPDGSRILVIHQTGMIRRTWGLPGRFRNMYNSARLFPSEPEVARITVTYFKEDLSPFATTSNILIANGGDHMVPQKWIPKVIEKVNGMLEDAVVLHGSLPEYVERIRSENPKLEVYRGESYERMGAGTSSRIYLKQANVKCQMLLERWVEPFSAFAWTLGKPYPEGLIWYAWKHVLRNQAHDSIWGTSIDDVHEEMMARFKRAEEVASELAEEALMAIAEKIDTGEGQTKIVVFNPHNRPITDVTKASVYYPIPERAPRKPSPTLRKIGQVVVKDTEGNIIPSQMHEVRRVRRRFRRRNYDLTGLDPLGTRWTIPCQEVEFNFIAENIPAFGYKTYTIETGEEAVEANKIATTLKTDSNSLENEFVRVTVNPNGTLNILDKTTGREYENLNLYEDGGDAGNAWHYRKPQKDCIVTSHDVEATVSVAERSPVRGTLKISSSLDLPKSLDEEGLARSVEIIKCPITTYVSLYLRVPRIDIKVEFENKVKDHRLRAVFPSGIHSDYAYADGHYGVIKRSLRTSHALPAELFRLALHFLRSFIDINDGKHGFVIITRGLHEYEVMDKEGTIAITLLRAVAQHPGAQCLGKHCLEYAVLVHKGDWKSAYVYRQANQFNTPLKAIQTDGHHGTLPREMSFATIEPEELVVTAVKKAEKEESLILRFYNITDEAVQGKARFYRPIKEAVLTNFNEETLEGKLIKVDGREASLDTGPAKIITLKVTSPLESLTEVENFP